LKEESYLQDLHVDGRMRYVTKKRGTRGWGVAPSMSAWDPVDGVSQRSKPRRPCLLSAGTFV